MGWVGVTFIYSGVHQGLSLGQGKSGGRLYTRRPCREPEIRTKMAPDQSKNSVFSGIGRHPVTDKPAHPHFIPSEQQDGGMGRLPRRWRARGEGVWYAHKAPVR